MDVVKGMMMVTAPCWLLLVVAGAHQAWQWFRGGQ
jgi:hypothetical protein